VELEKMEKSSVDPVTLIAEPFFASSAPVR